MGVKAREHPKGSGRWVVFVNKGKFRYNQVIKEGEERARDVAHRVSIILETMGVRAVMNLLRGADPTQLDIPTVEEYADKLEASLNKSDLKHTTKQMYKSCLKIHIKPGLGKRLVTEITYNVLKEFLEAKIEDTYSTGRFRSKAHERKYKNVPPEKRKYSRDSIRIMKVTLNALMSEAVKDGYIDTNPVKDLSKLYRKRRNDRAVKRTQVYLLEELYAIEDILKERREIFGEDYEFSLLMSRTGMRIGEAMGLRPEDLDMENRNILIERNIPASTGELEESTKTHSSERTVDMGEDLYLALRDLLVKRRAALFAMGRKHSEWLFSSPEGGHVDYRRFYESWQRAHSLAHVRFRPPHSLRHTYASQQLEAGVNIADVAQQLGHANPGITLAIYVHFIPKKRGQIRNALDRAPSGNESNVMQKD